VNFASFGQMNPFRPQFMASPLSGDLCRPSFPGAVELFVGDSAEAPDEAVGSGVAAPDAPPVEDVALVVGVVDAARVADAVPAHARRGAAAPWPDAGPVPHEAFESVAVAVRESRSPADGKLPADAVLAHAVRRLATELRAVAEQPHAALPGAHCSLPPVAEPARN
jgi:hypothetical protein